MQPWTKAVIFGAVSTAVIAGIQIAPSPEPGFAGAAFVYNILFFFPSVIVSLVCWTPALVYYVLFLRHTGQKTSLRVALPVLLLLACPCQLAIIARGLWVLHHLPPPPA